MNLKTIILGLILWSFSLPVFADSSQQKTSNSTNSETGALSWKTEAHGVYFSLTQILPEQAQAFYVNRGFTLEQIEAYANSCVYMTVLRNDNAPGKIHFISNNWTVLFEDKPKPLVSVKEWIERLTAAKIRKPALIAFRWAQFPPEQEYEPGGDWNQGMLSVGLLSGSKFDVIARWDIDGTQYETTLQGVQCAK